MCRGQRSNYHYFDESNISGLYEPVWNKNADFFFLFFSFFLLTSMNIFFLHNFCCFLPCQLSPHLQLFFHVRITFVHLCPVLCSPVISLTCLTCGSLSPGLFKPARPSAGWLSLKVSSSVVLSCLGLVAILVLSACL